MKALLEDMGKITKWDSYEDAIPMFEKIIATDEFKEFPKMKDIFYVEALAYFSLNHWDDLPIHCQALVLSLYPIFINKVAYGKTIEEYNEKKKELKQVFDDLNLPQIPLFENECTKLTPVANRQYFSFLRNGQCKTAMTLDDCRKLADLQGKGLIQFNLTFELDDDLLPSIVVYNRLKNDKQRLVSESTINSLKLVKETDPQKSDKEYEILIDKDDCLICLDYGNVGFFTISNFSVPKKFILENRCIGVCTNEFILEHLKIEFMHSHNNRPALFEKTIQDEINEISKLINRLWDDDKNKFIKNLEEIKESDYPLYLYLYWIKNDDSIHNRYQAFNYALNWISDKR